MEWHFRCGIMGESMGKTPWKWGILKESWEHEMIDGSVEKEREAGGTKRWSKSLLVTSVIDGSFILRQNLMQKLNQNSFKFIFPNTYWIYHSYASADTKAHEAFKNLNKTFNFSIRNSLVNFYSVNFNSIFLYCGGCQQFFFGDFHK